MNILKAQTRTVKKCTTLFLLLVEATVALPVIAARSETTNGSRAKSTVQNPHGKLTEAQALDLVSNRPEVKKWQSQVQEANKKQKTSAHIALDRKEGHDFVVQVFEEVFDGGDESHTATFNWYHVNDLTGKVRTEL